MAFLGRYGHQPVDAVMRLPITDALELAEQTAKLIQDENDAMRSRMETDGA